MNNSYYIHTGKAILYTSNQSFYGIDSIYRTTTTNYIDDVSPENFNVIVFGATHQSIPVDQILYERSRDFPLTVSEVYEKFYKPDQAYLNFIPFYDDGSSQVTKNIRQGIAITDNDINFQPGQKALLSS